MAGLNSPSVTLNDDHRVPQLGLGVLQVKNEDVPRLIADAVDIGYRHFDTASHYANEAGIGEAMRQLSVDRSEVCVTTKLPNWAHGYDEALRAFDASEAAIGKIDLYLVHWPQPMKGLYRDSWKALVRLRDEGRVRSIGVANFTATLIEELIADTGVTPAINQVELHPAYQQHALRGAHAGRSIATEAWSPLEQGRILSNPIVREIAIKHDCTAAQSVLAWHLRSGVIVIPKAADRRHLADNFGSLEVVLDEADMNAMATLDRPDGKFGPDPMLHFT